MRRILLAIPLFVVLFASGCQPAAPPIAVSNTPVSINDRPAATSNLPLSTSKPMGEMSWTDSKDRVQKVSDLKGKAVILDFWATFCEPCRREIPHLNGLLAKHKGRGLEVLGLNVGGEEDLIEIPKFVKDTKLDYPIVFPEVELTAWVFAERDDIPQTIVLDREGKIVDRFVGFNPEIQRDLDAAVEKALASSQPAS